MKLGLVIPYRATPTRQQALNVVLKWYEDNYPDIDIFYADKEGEWQHSGSRNIGVKKAQEAHCDIIIMNDADTIPERKSLDAAINVAQNDLLIHNPYTMCHYLNEEQTQEVINNKKTVNDFEGSTIQLSWICGGIFVFQPEAWWKLGGMDEKVYTGPEDVMMEIAHSVIHGIKFAKHHGNIYCLWHERVEKETQEDYAREEYNQQLYSEYLTTTTPQGILSLVKRK